MKTDVFNLQIIPIDQISAHESYDNKRSGLLAGKFKKDNVLRNPIIVAPLTKTSFVQLDGMNRLSTFRSIGLKSILCQIVDYQDMENVELASWVHFINADSDKFISFLGQVPDLIISKGNIDELKNRYVQSEGVDRICTYVGEKLQVYFVTTNGKLLEKVKKLSEIVEFYKNDIVRDVLPHSASPKDVKFLFKEHLKHRQMLVFPTFTRHQIVKVVKLGGFFPPGITRHVIRRRCMNVNIPMRIFDINLSIEKQNEELEEILRVRKFRLYEEPTIYFE